MAPSTTNTDAGVHVLGARSLIKYMATTLPTTPSSQLSNPYDAVALLSHCILLAVGYRLVGLGEDHRIETSPDEAADESSTRRLPDTWKDTSPNFAFRYKHTQSSMEYLLKINRMGPTAVIMGMALGHDKTASFDIKVDDYISPSSLPLKIDHESSDSDHETLARSIRDIFISEGRIADFGANMRINIIQKLLPSLQKEGYQEDAPSTTQTQSQQPQQSPINPYHPDPTTDPLLARPHRHAPTGEFLPPGFEDPYDLHRPPGVLDSAGARGPGFGSIGHNDLYPPGMGPRDPLHSGPRLGGGGFGGGGGLPHPGFGGGMHPDFHDPVFRNQGGSGAGAPQGYDPSAPLGARYDPVGPGGAPRMGGGRPGFGSGRGSGGPPNPFDRFGGGDFI